MQSSGGGSSNNFGSAKEEALANRRHKMSSNIFGSPEETPNMPKRSNPPGGKESGIFCEPNAAPFRRCTNPPGGKCSDIFGNAINHAPVLQHPSKPKDNITLHGGGESLQPKSVSENTKVPMEIQEEKKDLRKDEYAKEPAPCLADHEPRLGAPPRSHNKVLNPPGGKSSITFY